MAERTSPVQQTQPPSLEDPNAVEVNHETAPSDHQIQVSPAVYYYNDPFLLPPGFRFVPKDKEIIYYLNSFLHGHLNPFLYGYSIFGIDIHLVNIYKYNPEQLAAGFKKGNDENEWFFITERRKKYDRGTRTDCSANGGYWKATESETKFRAGKDMLGSQRTLVFYNGKQPRSSKTDWIMKEYRLDDPLHPPSSNNEDNKMLDTVLCKFYLSPMGKKMKAEEEQEVEGKYLLPRPSSMDELSRIFYPRQQKASRLGDSTEDHSLDPNLSEDMGGRLTKIPRTF